MEVIMRKAARLFSIGLLMGFMLAGLSPVSGYASWSTDPAVNTAISSLTDNASGEPQIISDGSGGAIIAWEKYSGGDQGVDIHAQRVDANGNILWTSGGVTICNANGHQMYPQLVGDGSGGAIITWTDGRGGAGNDIYAQKIDAAGNVMWTANGVVICNATNEQTVPQIISDYMGGAIITWQDNRTLYDIYVQRIDSAGVVQWTPNGVAVCTADNVQQAPQIATDGSGGAIITWQDHRDSYAKIYAQRVSDEGVIMWTTVSGGVKLSWYEGSSTWQSTPRIVADDVGAIVTWEDNRTGGGSVYAQKILINGTLYWGNSAVAVYTAASSDNTNTGPVLSADGSGGAIIAWMTYRFGHYNILARRIAANGTAQWAAEGVYVFGASITNQPKQQIIGDGSGGAIIAWHDNQIDTGSFAYDVYAQRIGSDGLTQWTTNGVTISNAANAQQLAHLVGDGNNGAIITWLDYRNAGGNGIIYAQKILSGGTFPISPPTVTTSAVTDITSTTATGGGNVTSIGGGEVTARGVCWSTAANPTAADSHTTDGSGAGVFGSSITALTSATTYHIRAYATNVGGTAYGDDRSFSTDAILSVTIQGAGEGEVHSTVQDINCTGGTCTENFVFGASIDLTPTPSLHSIFNGWSDGCTGLTVPCTIAMSQNRRVNASFVINPAEAVWNDPGSIYYDKIGTAYQNATSGVTVIKACRLEITENLNLNMGKTVTLSGGWNSGYSNDNGLTTVKGTMTIGSGVVSVGNIAVK
jgi:hypothetical protein